VVPAQESQRYGLPVRKYLALLIVLVLAACSGDDSGSSAAGDGGSDGVTTTTASSSDDGGGSDGSGTDGSGDVDCDAIDEANAAFIVPVQLLAQVRDPVTFESVKSGTVGNLDIDAFLAAVDEMHALDDVETPLGDPKEALDVYEAAGDKMKELLDAGTVTQADIDELVDIVGPVSDFLGHQIAIAGALDTVGC
jgi:hypothetical protein